MQVYSEPLRAIGNTARVERAGINHRVATSATRNQPVVLPTARTAEDLSLLCRRHN